MCRFREIDRAVKFHWSKYYLIPYEDGWSQMSQLSTRRAQKYRHVSKYEYIFHIGHSEGLQGHKYGEKVGRYLQFIYSNSRNTEFSAWEQGADENIWTEEG
jgi:hypothetical protein